MSPSLIALFIGGRHAPAESAIGKIPARQQGKIVQLVFSLDFFTFLSHTQGKVYGSFRIYFRPSAVSDDG